MTIEQNWSEEFSVGVEEELMILDAETFEQRPEVDEIIAGVGAVDGEVKQELFASVVELTSGVCETPAQAIEKLRALRGAASRAAGEHGLVLAGAGSHPLSDPKTQSIASNPRYSEFVAYAGISAKRQGVSGLHVHVGMPDADACLRTLERVLPWLPVVLALSANSPYFDGRESGMMSIRAEILGILPRHGAPPAFETFADWERFVERFVAAGLVPGYSALHWDIRPHPTFGTLEIRAADQPTSLGHTGRLVLLLYGLCVWAIEQPVLAPDAGRRGVYEQNRWAAARFGPRATLLHPERDGFAGVPELYAELVERIGVVPGFDPATCEGDRQLAVGRAEGLRAVCADLAARSVP